MKAQSEFYSLPPAASHPAAFDWLEVHTVVETDTYCEAIPAGDEIPTEGTIFWTLYGHTPGQGVEAIGDFASFELACEFAERLGGLPVR